MRRLSVRYLCFTAGALWLIAGCDEPTATRSMTDESPTSVLSEVTATVLTAPSLLVCPSTTAQSASATIGPNGGILSVGGNVVVIPRGAVPTDTKFTITVPASQHLEVDISAEGFDTFNFAVPALIALDYGRCADSAIPSKSLAAWYIDRSTKSLLQLMGSFDDRLTRHVIFATGHLSGYAIAQ
ncbi:MAG TPA: hypothetical protein VFK13_01025 [Gemmatimonadaceae bacterium]|nr:hypothetical protein [Gemmatimonadaceae bacterium]